MVFKIKEKTTFGDLGRKNKLTYKAKKLRLSSDFARAIPFIRRKWRIHLK